MKTTVCEMKDIIGGIHDRLDIAEVITELEDTAIETIQMKHREKNYWKSPIEH